MATDGAAKRATYLSQTEDTAVNFFGRLQWPDGSWRWNEDGEKPDDQLRNIEQPFMGGVASGVGNPAPPTNQEPDGKGEPRRNS